MPEGKFDLRCPECTKDRVESIRAVPHLVDCVTCKKPFDIGSGYILLHVCPSCLAKPPRQVPYIERSGLLVPNPDAKDAAV